MLARVMLAARPAMDAAADPVLLDAITAGLRSDPPLLIYTALTSWEEAFSPSEEDPLADLAAWLMANVSDQFARVDALLGAPKAVEDHHRRWQQLDDHFCTLPVRRWLSQAALWLEVAGPPVPLAWQQLWPSLDLPESLPSPGPGFPAPTLPQLARWVNRTRVLENSFSASLQREKLDAVRQLAYGLSHEINNPLANISTRAQQLQRGEQDPERVQMLQRIVDQVYRAHAMIADLMFFANPPTATTESLDLSVVVREAAEPFFAEAQRLAIQLQVAGCSGVVELAGDRRMIGEAVGVLLRNAIDAVGSSGTVIVRVDATADEARVQVADSGPGLSEEARRHAFDPYFSGREAGRGLGLGLCRAYRIACLHDAELSLSGTPVGCAATLVLPRRPRHLG